MNRHPSACTPSFGEHETHETFQIDQCPEFISALRNEYFPSRFTTARECTGLECRMQRFLIKTRIVIDVHARARQITASAERGVGIAFANVDVYRVEVVFP